MRLTLTLLLATLATPALAQHAGHAMPAPTPTPAPTQEPAEEKPEQTDHSAMDHGDMNQDAMDHSTMQHGDMRQDAMDHGSMDHSTMDHGAMEHGATQDTSMDHGSMDHGTMDHGSMDHGSMDHGSMDHGSMDHGAMTQDEMQDGATDPRNYNVPLGPPPAEAGSGIARTAEAIWGVDAMRQARAELIHETGAASYFWFQGDRVEYRARQGDDGYLFDIQGYYGGDLDKFWFKSEGEGSFGEEIEGAEIQALYSRAIAPFFDLQAGIRQDLTGPTRTHAVIGIQGLAPYLFELDGAAFLSDKGDLTARVEAELDQRITQRLILQPRAEISLSAQDIPELGIGAGLDAIEAGLRLRYEFAREFAPYIGIDQEWKIGQSADYARLEGEDSSVTNYVVGVRFWF